MSGLQRDLERAINWASVDALANTPDFELAEKIMAAPFLDDYVKESCCCGVCGL